MKYITLPFLTNKYPKIGNYVATDTNKVSLLGLYPTVNKVDFTLPNVNELKVVEETSFRNIIAIYKDKSDNSPKYYTSQFYSNDLIKSKNDSNPYFINYSFQQSSIIKIYLKDIIQSISPLREKDLEAGVAFVRNNFILYNNSGLTVQSEVQTQTVTNPGFASSNPTNRSSYAQEQVDALTNKIAIHENALQNADRDITLRRGFLYGPNRRKAIYTVDGFTYESKRENWNASDNTQRNDIKEQLSAKISGFKLQKAEAEKNLPTTSTNQTQPTTSTYTFQTTKRISLDPNKIDKDIKKVLSDIIAAKEFDDIIEMDGFYIDCIHLVKYIDWILSKPTFDEVETNGVIPADKLTVFKVKDELPANVDTDSPKNKDLPKGDENNRIKKYYNYRIIRLSIPASEEASSMTYLDTFGLTKEIRTDKYGEIGTFCVQEGSFRGSIELYQRIQEEPCNVQKDTNTGGNTGGGNGGIGGGGRGGGGGSNDNYYIREQNSNIQYIDYNRDRANLE